MSLQTDLVFEQDGGVVDDSVASTELLEYLGRGADSHSSEVLLLAVVHQVFDGSLLLLSGDDGVQNEVTLLNGSRVMNAGTVERGDDLQALFELAVGKEPSGGLAERKGAPHEDCGEDDLQRNGKTP